MTKDTNEISYTKQDFTNWTVYDWYIARYDNMFKIEAYRDAFHKWCKVYHKKIQDELRIPLQEKLSEKEHDKIERFLGVVLYNLDMK